MKKIFKIDFIICKYIKYIYIYLIKYKNENLTKIFTREGDFHLFFFE